jgi:eukaryotic-like serine/threonine-protein kinase
MVGEVIAGRYELEELVGTGGMSSVYRAEDRMLERKVALKILHDYHGADEASIERFRREARSAAQLSHPNIVTVIDRGEDSGRHFIVFEYVQGENVKALLERDGRLPPRRALELAIATGDALAFAHAHGLVHRDVKPQNVLLNGDGEAKVTDFGIARAVDVQSVTESGTVLGTSYYIAPEQASGRGVDAQTDVYSLGVVLFELLTARLPFEGENFVAVAMQHIHEAPPSVLEFRPDVPVRVAHAIERALAKDPADRFESMEEFVSELRACLADLGTEPEHDSTLIIPARPSAPSRPRSRPVRRRRRPAWPVVLLALGLLLLAGVVAAALALSRDSSPDEEPAGAAGGQIRLTAAADYDPEGGDGEHPELVARATDNNAQTYWRTEEYEDFSATKSGVGLVLDAGREVQPSEIVVQSSTPGFTARIDAGAQTSGPFEPATEEQEVGSSTTFELDDVEARYFVVWITKLPGGVAQINEVRAT